MATETMEIIINNKDVKISKTEIESSNLYNLQYCISNKNMYLDKLINFNFLSIIYELNKSLFDDFKVNIISEDRATVYILFKWLFKDFDIKHYCVFLEINKVVIDANTICFECVSDNNNINNDLKSDIQILHIDKLTICFDITDKHLVHINNTICFKKNPILVPYIQKMISQIISKMIINSKQFIEKMS